MAPVIVVPAVVAIPAAARMAAVAPDVFAPMAMSVAMSAVVAGVSAAALVDMVHDDRSGARGVHMLHDDRRRVVEAVHDRDRRREAPAQVVEDRRGPVVPRDRRRQRDDAEVRVDDPSRDRCAWIPVIPAIACRGLPRRRQEHKCRKSQSRAARPRPSIRRSHFDSSRERVQTTVRAGLDGAPIRRFPTGDPPHTPRWWTAALVAHRERRGGRQSVCNPASSGRARATRGRSRGCRCGPRIRRNSRARGRASTRAPSPSRRRSSEARDRDSRARRWAGSAHVAC